MEEIKNLETSEKLEGHHHGHSCHGMMCKCGPMGHKFIKLVMAFFVVIALLSIGAALGRHCSHNNYRYSENFGRYNDNYGEAGGCPMREAQFQGGGIRDGRQFNMMRGQTFQVAQPGFQVIESSGPATAPSVNATYIKVGTSTQVNPVK